MSGLIGATGVRGNTCRQLEMLLAFGDRVGTDDGAQVPDPLVSKRTSTAVRGSAKVRQEYSCIGEHMLLRSVSTVLGSRRTTAAQIPGALFSKPAGWCNESTGYSGGGLPEAGMPVAATSPAHLPLIL